MQGGSGIPRSLLTPSIERIWIEKNKSKGLGRRGRSVVMRYGLGHMDDVEAVVVYNT